MRKSWNENDEKDMEKLAKEAGKSDKHIQNSFIVN